MGDFKYLGKGVTNQNYFAEEVQTRIYTRHTHTHTPSFSLVTFITPLFFSVIWLLKFKHTIIFNTSIFWVIIPCSPFKVNRRFERILFIACFILVSWLSYSSTLKMDTCYCKTWDDFQRTTRLLLTLPPSVSLLSRKYGSFDVSQQSGGLHGLLQG
jgi:hypothetical protein